MNVVNKFNIYWQITRVEAKSMLTTTEKINHVLLFLKNYPNTHNYQRVMNWTKMSMLGCCRLSRQEYESFELWLRRHVARFKDQEDTSNSFITIDTSYLELVFRDLDKRGMNFYVTKQYAEFMNRLETELKKRGVL